MGENVIGWSAGPSGMVVARVAVVARLAHPLLLVGPRDRQVQVEVVLPRSSANLAYLERGTKRTE